MKGTGSSLFLRQFGERGSSRSILFLHGGGLSGAMWTDVAARLPEFHCLVPDLPGHGLSAGIAPLQLEDCTERLTDLIVSNTDKAVHLVGLSLGGALALHLLKEKPALLERVVISGTSSGLSRAMAAVNSLNAPLYRFLPSEWLASILAKGMAIPARYRPQLVEAASKITPQTVKDMSRLLTEFELPDRSVPDLLVLVGELENSIAQKSSLQIMKRLHAQGCVVPGAGHAWNYQFPDLFADVVRRWVVSEPLPSALQRL